MNDNKSTQTTITSDTKQDAAPKAPLFVRFVQPPKVRTGLKSGIRNPV